MRKDIYKQWSVCPPIVCSAYSIKSDCDLGNLNLRLFEPFSSVCGISAGMTFSELFMKNHITLSILGQKEQAYKARISAIFIICQHFLSNTSKGVK